jgi:hypothetical protein
MLWCLERTPTGVQEGQRGGYVRVSQAHFFLVRGHSSVAIFYTLLAEFCYVETMIVMSLVLSVMGSSASFLKVGYVALRFRTASMTQFFQRCNRALLIKDSHYFLELSYKT